MKAWYCERYMKFFLFIGVISNGICARFFFTLIFNPSESIFVRIDCVTFRDEILPWTCPLQQQSFFLAKVV